MNRKIPGQRTPVRGLGKVYGFTLRQLFRNKANIISFGILLAVILLAVPIASLIMGPAENEVSFLSQVFTMEEFLADDTDDLAARMAVQYVYSILAMVVCVFSCTYIVRSIVEEKSSRLVETLMLSVDSRAMILGKLLAALTFVFSMVILMAAAFALSYFVTGQFLDVSGLRALLESMGLLGGFNIGADMAAVLLVSLALAYAFFALIAALSGAGCADMEDVEAANMTAMMIVFAGYIFANMALPLGFGQTFFAVCPVVSAFSLPVYYAVGDIGIATVLISWAVQAVCILLIYRTSAKLYDSLVMYNGSRLKLRQILKLSRSGGGAS